MLGGSGVLTPCPGENSSPCRATGSSLFSSCALVHSSGIYSLWLGAAGAAVGAPLVLGVIGFKAAGIAVGSVAASMMSSAATASGGGVLAGSAVALFQSIGAAGLAGSTSAALTAAGGLVGALFL
uniref:Interferon alpha-inducible protein 27-like protein 2A n=1 Tax=Sphenodon punctatus TaxID=8508 RepID=A0A8D0G672_SPHPU